MSGHLLKYFFVHFGEKNLETHQRLYVVRYIFSFKFSCPKTWNELLLSVLDETIKFRKCPKASKV